MLPLASRFLASFCVQCTQKTLESPAAALDSSIRCCGWSKRGPAKMDYHRAAAAAASDVFSVDRNPSFASTAPSPPSVRSPKQPSPIASQSPALTPANHLKPSKIEKKKYTPLAVRRGALEEEAVGRDAVSAPRALLGVQAAARARPPDWTLEARQGKEDWIWCFHERGKRGRRGEREGRERQRRREEGIPRSAAVDWTPPASRPLSSSFAHPPCFSFYFEKH